MAKLILMRNGYPSQFDNQTDRAGQPLKGGLLETGKAQVKDVTNQLITQSIIVNEVIHGPNLRMTQTAQKMVEAYRKAGFTVISKQDKSCLDKNIKNTKIAKSLLPKQDSVVAGIFSYGVIQEAVYQLTGKRLPRDRPICGEATVLEYDPEKRAFRLESDFISTRDKLHKSVLQFG